MRLVAAEAQGSVHAYYAATFGSVDQAGQRWGHRAKDAGRGLNSKIHVVADGAPWIDLQRQEVFGADSRMMSDFYHVSEYLAAASRTRCPEFSKRWFETKKKRLMQGESGLVIEALEEHCEAPTVDDD